MPSAYPSTPPRPLRRDAQENRDRILVAARATFEELGCEASVEEVASRAGVGVGTVYRRFPTKEALIDAVFDEHLDRVAGYAEEALREPDPWEAFSGYLHRVVGLQAADRGVSEILGGLLRQEQRVIRLRKRLRPLVEELISRAQAAGELRSDIGYEDVSILLWTTGSVAAGTRDVAPLFWQRHLALLLAGLRTETAAPLPRPPLSTRQHAAAMRMLQHPSPRRR